MSLTEQQDSQAVSLIRGISMDGPLAANSGHQGTGMALAPLAHVLYSRVMKHDPADPHWPDRDRFVLSNGHASIMQYAMLFLSGYGLELDDLKNFRQWESATPGHPEVNHTAGVEVTTGPLGQGFANAVGMAVAEANQRARFGSDAVDHHTFVIAGDGCMMEGISHEAADLAGHLGLGHLICIFDDNKITIDGATDLATDVDMAERFRAYGWDVVELGDIANDLDALEAALEAAKSTDKPSFLILRTHVAHPSPKWEDDHSAHGNPFSAEDVTETKQVMGIPDEPFWAPDELVSAYRTHVGERGATAHAAWTAPDSADWAAAHGATGLEGWDADLPAYEQGESLATRKAIQKALDETYAGLPGLMSGSADLKGSNGVALGESHPFSSKAPDGRYLHFGIREHAMGAMAVGMALHGGVLPVTATFFVFADYMRPPIRLAAISDAKVCFVFTHDSVGVGEDGPTHQPVEQLASLRAIPNLHVIRPADGNETIHAWADAVRHDGPSVLVLSRQDIEVTTDGSAVARGAGIVRRTDGDPAVVLVGTGSEVAVCVEAASTLAENGIAAQVVSLPSMDRFQEQDVAFRSEIFPDGVPVLSVEAGVTFGWAAYADDSIGIDRFGASAPGNLVLDKLGINVGHVVERATALVN
ncbi:transketolase [Ilumatobacter nonamiensis]|uniref:transketolase n=1 Tax=Ilumatobacter nonamiensis TaxID=467093 RepID=UPI0003495FC4|nr:transketolase [Ilumatobacter nonamiensis]